jgi:NRAMP (natural resistance-associated macrophage protein)-like metal ion transporter
LAKRKTPGRATRRTGASARLEEARAGDIRGALGTIRHDELPPRHSWRGRLKALLAIMGPGLIVMVGDNDAGGVSTYAQAGQNHGTTLLWTLILLIPVVIVNQEMVVRLGAVTGVGQARLIFERFGRFWGSFSVGGLFLVNFLTIVTEFIGITLALEYLGLNRYLIVPVAALAMIAITTTGGFQHWERFMYVFVASNLLVIPLALLSHPRLEPIARGSFVPGVEGGIDSTSLLLIVAIVGTTVAPWQLFFQQSNVIDKRITPRWINYERADTMIGSVIVVVGAAALMITTAFAFEGTALAGHFVDARHVASALARRDGHLAGVLFAVVLLNASIIGAQAVTLSTSYALGDAFGVRHSLHRSLGEAKSFYAAFSGLILLAAAIVLIPRAPLGLVTISVQALAGILLPSSTTFLLMLCNDRQVLGPWVNRGWLNAVATLIVGSLLALSGILVVTTVFPGVDVVLLALCLGGALALALAALALSALRTARRRRAEKEEEEEAEQPVARESWTMPPLALLEKPLWSPARRAAMYALIVYLVVAVSLLVVKAVELGLGR